MSSVKDFGAIGDGKADDTAAIQHTINDGEGVVEFEAANIIGMSNLLYPISAWNVAKPIKVGRQNFYSSLSNLN